MLVDGDDVYAVWMPRHGQTVATGLHPRVRSQADGSHYTGTGVLPLVPGIDGVGRAPDAFPFPFLCFWASTESIFLSLFILISQATQSQKDRVRNEIEYRIALKLQTEVTQIRQRLDEQAADRTAATNEPGVPVIP